VRRAISPKLVLSTTRSFTTDPQRLLITPSRSNSGGKTFFGIVFLMAVIGCGTVLMHASAKNKPLAAFKPTALERVAVPRVSVTPVPAPSVSVPSFSIRSPEPKPVKFIVTRPPRSSIPANHESKAQRVLRTEKPVDSGAPDGSFLERHLSGQSFPRLPTELYIGRARCWQSSVELGYGQPCEDESVCEVCSMGPRREEPGSAYLKITVNF